MPESRDMTLNEALLMYTEAKLEIAARFRDGISYDDFSEFEKKIDLFDSILKREAFKIQNLLEKENQHNVY